MHSAEASRGHRQLDRQTGTLETVRHPVCCRYCQSRFDLFAAAWCTHRGGQPSKTCPACMRCLCDHPAYGEPHFWRSAPPGFQQRGFQQLFLFYL